MPDRWPHASTRSRTCRAGPPAHAFTQTRKQKRRDDSSLLCVVPCDAAFGTGSSGRPDDVPPTSVPGCAASTRWIIQRTHAALPSPLQGSPAWTPAGAHPSVRSTCPPPVLTKQPPQSTRHSSSDHTAGRAQHAGQWVTSAPIDAEPPSGLFVFVPRLRGDASFVCDVTSRRTFPGARAPQA